MTESKKSATMEELLSSKKRTLKTFRRGEVVEGTVISADRKEVFVDLGSKSEGIIDSREIEEDLDPIYELEVGDKVVATVVQTENDQGYTILSLKKAQGERVWRKVEKAFENKEVLPAKVVDSNKGGLVVELLEGLRGFVPFSHLTSFSPDSSKPSLLNKTLKLQVIELNRAINRLVLSERLADLVSDPQTKDFFKDLKPGQKLKGAVTAIHPFGIFVELDSRIEGLVHISEMCWGRIDSPEGMVEVGDEVEVEVMDIDRKEGKVGLSMRALQENPWEKIAETYKVGDKVSGTITKTVSFGAFVRLPEGIEGLIHVSETAGPLYEGDEVEVVVINLEPKEQKLGLSVKQLK